MGKGATFVPAHLVLRATCSKCHPQERVFDSKHAALFPTLACPNSGCLLPWRWSLRFDSMYHYFRACAEYWLVCQALARVLTASSGNPGFEAGGRSL